MRTESDVIQKKKEPLKKTTLPEPQLTQPPKPKLPPATTLPQALGQLLGQAYTAPFPNLNMVGPSLGAQVAGNILEQNAMTQPGGAGKFGQTMGGGTQWVTTPTVSTAKPSGKFGQVGGGVVWAGATAAQSAAEFGAGFAQGAWPQTGFNPNAPTGAPGGRLNKLQAPGEPSTAETQPNPRDFNKVYPGTTAFDRWWWQEKGTSDVLIPGTPEYERWRARETQSPPPGQVGYGPNVGDTWAQQQIHLGREYPEYWDYLNAGSPAVGYSGGGYGGDGGYGYRGYRGYGGYYPSNAGTYGGLYNWRISP